MKKSAPTQRESLLSSKPSNIFGLLLGSAGLIAVFLWLRSTSIPAEQENAVADTTRLAEAPANTPATMPSALGEDKTLKGNRPVVSLALKSTGALNSGELVAKLMVNDATAVYLAGDRLGADTSILSVRENEVSIQRGATVETLHAEIRGSTFGQRPAALRPMPRPANAAPNLAAASASASDAAPEVASYGTTLTQPPAGNLAAMLGLQAGDTVAQINGRTVASGDDIGALLAELESKKVPVWVQGRRNDRPFTLRFRP